MPFRSIALAVGVLTACAALAVLQAQPAPPKKMLIAHRGASAYAPEHSIDSYTLAMKQGADFVEQDLAVTKDRVLVSIHDLTLERTTDVEEVFPDRFVEVKAGTTVMRHWYVNDFTLAEIKRLDAGIYMDKKFAGTRILTFQEAIDLVKGAGKPGVGLYTTPGGGLVPPPALFRRQPSCRSDPSRWPPVSSSRSRRSPSCRRSRPRPRRS